MVASRVVLFACSAMLTAATALTPAFAGYVAGAGADGKCAFSATQGWTFPAAGVDNSGVLGGPNWLYNLNSPAPAAPGNRNLQVNILHADPGPCDKVHGAAPNIALDFPNVQRPPIGPVGRAVARKEPHGDHSDYGLAALTVPAAGNLTARLRGYHGEAPPADWSFENVGTTGYSSVVVIPSYRNADGSITNGAEINAGPVSAGGKIKGQLPRDANGNLPTNYTVRAFGSPMTETTLAFLGTIPGIAGVTELELAPMIAMLGGSFVVPVLREHGQVDELYVFVDLTTFLGTETPFDLFTDWTFLDGVSESLPGIFAFTSPFVLGADGVPTGIGYDGVLFADALIDGTVPAPGGLALLPALAAVLVSARAARARAP